MELNEEGIRGVRDNTKVSNLCINERVFKWSSLVFCWVFFFFKEEQKWLVFLNMKFPSSTQLFKNVIFFSF